MNEKEFLAISSVIKAAYPNQGIMPSKESLDVWYGMLKDLDYVPVRNAVQEIIATSKYAPSIAEIREKATQRVTEQVPEWGDAWEEVLKAIRRHGYMQELDALNSMSEITRRCVKRLGWQNICMSENITADRANFRTIYEKEMQSKRTEMQIPISVRNEKMILLEQAIGNVSGLIGGAG